MVKIDIEMPIYCHDCPCQNGENGCCNITNYSTFDKRPFDCPLKEVKHGKWVDKGTFTVMCSCCEHYVLRNLLLDYQTMNFCPVCGAKMDGKETEK